MHARILAAALLGVFTISPAAQVAGAYGAGLRDIHVDQRCRVLPDPSVAASAGGGKKIRPLRDPVICHIESVLDSRHREEMVIGNELHRSNVEVAEQEYVLQDIFPQPVAFVVEQEVMKGWIIDSDPQPVQTVGSVAMFRVLAQPGQIVRLHVGMRHTIPLKTRFIRSAAPAQPGASGR